MLGAYDNIHRSTTIKTVVKMFPPVDAIFTFNARTHTHTLRNAVVNLPSTECTSCGTDTLQLETSINYPILQAAQNKNIWAIRILEARETEH